MSSSPCLSKELSAQSSTSSVAIGFHLALFSPSPFRSWLPPPRASSLSSRFCCDWSPSCSELLGKYSVCCLERNYSSFMFCGGLCVFFKQILGWNNLVLVGFKSKNISLGAFGSSVKTMGFRNLRQCLDHSAFCSQVSSTKFFLHKQLITARWSFVRVDLEKDSNQVIEVWRILKWYFRVIASCNLFVEPFHVLGLKRRMQSDHLIDHAA